MQNIVLWLVGQLKLNAVIAVMMMSASVVVWFIIISLIEYFW